MKMVGAIIGGLLLGLIGGYLLVISPLFTKIYGKKVFLTPLPFFAPKNQVIGFLPYWSLSSERTDYSPYLTQLSYFHLVIDTDGSIQKLVNEQEEEPGWHALRSGRVDQFLETAKRKNVQLSLTVFRADNDAIDRLMENPTEHARNLVRDLTPVMKQYGFTDLNLDIERVGEASKSSQVRFTQFVRELKKGMDEQDLGTLTVDISPADLIKQDLIHLPSIASSLDYLVIMGYDYHYIGSSVTGPVSPIGGAGIMAEFDITSALAKALALLPPEKIILGIPLYGYTWESLGTSPRSAVVPRSGATMSNQRAEREIAQCPTCTVKYDNDAQEMYSIHRTDEGTYQHTFFPDKKATQAKIDFAKKYHLGGLALWALGYEGSTILDPLKEYK